jgi:hypothetical protein
MTKTGAVFRAATPVLLWALHFAAIYALLSAACAPRELLAVEAARIVSVLLTAALAIAALALLVAAGRGLRRGAPDPAMEQAAWWSALISLLAILANAWPVATLPGCSG